MCNITRIGKDLFLETFALALKKMQFYLDVTYFALD